MLAKAASDSCRISWHKVKFAAPCDFAQNESRTLTRLYCGNAQARK